MPNLEAPQRDAFLRYRAQPRSSKIEALHSDFTYKTLSMIEAIAFLTNELNQHLKRKYGMEEDLVCISNLKNPDGSIESGLDNKIVVQLAGISQEALRSPGFGHLSKGDQTSSVSPPMMVSLSLLFCANFSGKKYEMGIQLIGSLLQFFHDQPLFSRGSFPALPEGLDKLTIDLLPFDLEESSKIWDATNGALLPSMLYRLRGIALPSQSIVEEIPTISGLDQSISHE